jgi:O-antigen/teichoic acid export membrane protein
MQTNTSLANEVFVFYNKPKLLISILMSIINKISKNFIIYGAGQAFNLLSPLLIAPYVISICGIANFGKTGLAFGLSLFLILIVDYAFDINGTKLVSENREDIKVIQNKLITIIYTKIVLVGISFLILIFLLYSIPLFRNEKTLFLFSFSIVIAQVFNPQWFLQGLENFKISSLINIFSKIIYVILVFYLVKSKDDYNYVNFYLGLSSILINVIGILVIQNRFKFSIQKPNLLEIKTILKTDFFFCISQLFLSLRQLFPLFVVSFLLGFSVAGQYKVVEQIISLFRTFNQVYLKYFFPRLCYKITQSKTQALLFWKKYVMVLIFLVLFLCVFLFVFSTHVIAFFNVSNIITSLFRLSLILPLLMVFSLALEQTMFTNDNNKNYIKITIFVTLVNIIALLILAPIFKLKGVIISIVIAELLFIFLYYKKSIVLKKE